MDALVQRGASASSVTVPEPSTIPARTTLTGGLISGEHYMSSIWGSLQGGPKARVIVPFLGIVVGLGNDWFTELCSGVGR